MVSFILTTNQLDRPVKCAIFHSSIKHSVFIVVDEWARFEHLTKLSKLFKLSIWQVAHIILQNERQVFDCC